MRCPQCHENDLQDNDITSRSTGLMDRRVAMKVLLERPDDAPETLRDVFLDDQMIGYVVREATGLWKSQSKVDETGTFQPLGYYITRREAVRALLHVRGVTVDASAGVLLPSEREEATLAFIKQNGVNHKQIADGLGFNRRSVGYYVHQLRRMGYLPAYEQPTPTSFVGKGGKLSPTELDICRKFAVGVTYPTLAKEYNTTESHIRSVRHRVARLFGVGSGIVALRQLTYLLAAFDLAGLDGVREAKKRLAGKQFSPAIICPNCEYEEAV